MNEKSARSIKNPGDVEEVYPGIHKNFHYYHFNNPERRAIKALSREFYITSGGKISLGQSSQYNYIFIKPTRVYGEMFNLDREMVVVFSRYNDVQPRTLDAFNTILKAHPGLRIEKICGVLISEDVHVETSLESLIKSEPESQIVIPFNIQEINSQSDNFFVRNRFRKYFYARDLFAFEAPLQRDIYFFGRSDLIQTLVNRYKSQENSGLFGLRKTGKTSLINGLERTLNKDKIAPVVVDCQSTAFNQRRWNEALYFLVYSAHKHLQSKIQLPAEYLFTEKDAAIVFEQAMELMQAESKHTLLFIFDEIENISRKTSPAKHWNSGLDFVLFWQTLRSIFQRNRSLLSYLIVGTNPSCIEVPRIDNVDNPLFNHFTPIFIPGFDVLETRHMTRKLGRKMGLEFDETIFSKLTEDFGGHPFLMRHVCSRVAKEVENSKRPTMVDRKTYAAGKSQFLRDNVNYLEMIVGVLREYYNDEYEMLCYLANGDVNTFDDFAASNPYYTNHLIGYGLIRLGPSGYDFCIDAIKDYIVDQSKFKKLEMTLEEKWAEISDRRNRVEVRLRKIVRSVLKSHLTEKIARDMILDIFGGTRKIKLGGMSYHELFDPIISEIYFIDLAKIISKNWDIFKNTFSHAKKDMYEKLDFINKSRAEAHAKTITPEEFAYFRLCMSAIESDIAEYF
jgi:hypothetical protein